MLDFYNNFDKSTKSRINEIIISVILILAASVFKRFDLKYVYIIFMLSAYCVSAKNIFKKAYSNIKSGVIFDENFLMAIASVGAIIIGELPEGVAVIIFYNIGELFQKLAVNKSRKKIKELMDIRPDYANIYQDGQLISVDPYEVCIGDIIVSKPGEKIALDGVIKKGKAMFDTSAMTGEAIPRFFKEGDEVLCGYINMDSLVEIEVIKEFDDSAAGKILELIENASSKKAKSEAFISKFAGIYTPIIVYLALAIAIIPNIIFGIQNYKDWIYRALTFLVVSCPCALVLSVPLSFFGGIGAASKLGILIKGGNYIDTLACVKNIVFDKTGTLTTGIFEVIKILPHDNMSEEEILELVASIEYYSTHPIAESIKKTYLKKNKSIDISSIKDVKEIPGKGIRAMVGEDIYFVGNSYLMNDNNINQFHYNDAVYISKGEKLIGELVISDRIKEEAKYLVKRLGLTGISYFAVLTGDNENNAYEVAKKIGIDNVFSKLLPYEKVEKIESIMKTNLGKTVFVGDGINDAPVLARADIGIAMGGIGSGASIEAADVVIVSDDLNKISTALKLAKRTIMIANENIFFALGIKISVLILAALGFASMWLAVFADVGVALIAVLNSLRNLDTVNLEK